MVGVGRVVVKAPPLRVLSDEGGRVVVGRKRRNMPLTRVLREGGVWLCNIYSQVRLVNKSKIQKRKKVPKVQRLS